MAFDSFVLSACLNELKETAMDARISKIHQPDKHTILLRYHGQNGGGKLLLSAHPQNGRLHITEATKENPAKAPLFAMVLRKWLDGARITGISKTIGERVAELQLLCRNDIGDLVPCRLIIEIMGKHSNIILVNDQGKIIDGIRRYGSSLSRYREVLPGKEYIAPPPITKPLLGNIDEDKLAAILFDDPDTLVKDTLLKGLCGISPMFAASAVQNANLLPNTLSGELGIYEISQLYQQLKKLADDEANNNFTPILLMDNGCPVDFAAFLPAAWQDKTYTDYPSMNQAVDALYLAKDEQLLFQRQKHQLQKAVNSNITRLDKKISLQEGDLRKSEEADKYKDIGDLLSAYQFYLKKGMDKIELNSFQGEDKTVTIKLDAALTPQENISRYYHKYSKAKNARSSIEQQLTANRSEFDYVLSIDNSINCAENVSELQIIAKEAATEGLIKTNHNENPKGKIKEKDTQNQLPPREYLSTDGLTILIGRNNKQNDKLTLKQAEENDTWLHTQKIPGSHVIIKSNGRDIPPATLTEAASAAAWFSRARDSDNVPVDYTLVKEVKKPAHAKPGMVIYFKQKTLYVTPQEPPKNQQ